MFCVIEELIKASGTAVSFCQKIPEGTVGRAHEHARVIAMSCVSSFT